MNTYDLNISGPEALVLQELLSNRITSLEYEIAENPGSDFDELAAMEAEFNHCQSLKGKLEQLFPED